MYKYEVFAVTSELDYRLKIITKTYEMAVEERNEISNKYANLIASKYNTGIVMRGCKKVN